MPTKPANQSFTFHEKLLQGLFPIEVSTVFSGVTGRFQDLFPEEQAIINYAVLNRKKEFAAGRINARKALAVLGISNFPVLMDERRAPILPKGISASVSHSSKYCAVVAGRVGPNQAMGLDIVELNRLKEEVWTKSFVDEEIGWLHSLADSEARNKWATVLFAVKEAFYKSQYQLTKAWVGFKDVQVECCCGKDKFTVMVLRDIAPEIENDTYFEGKFVFFEDHVAAGILLDIKK